METCHGLDPGRSECYAKARLLNSNSNNNSPQCGAELRDAG